MAMNAVNQGIATLQHLHEGGLSKCIEATGRRNELLGHWAADLMHLADKVAYASMLNEIDIAAAGRNDMIFKLRADFEHAGIPVTEMELDAAAKRFFRDAVEDVLKD
jgi:hypothetical protein